MPTKPKKKPARKPKPSEKPQAKAKPAKRKTIAGTSKAAAARKLALFIDAYLSNDGNGTQAAISAGYSEKTAYSAASRLLKRVEVKQAIAERSQKVAEKFGLTLDRTLQEIARLAYADPRRFYNADGSIKAIHELDDDTAASIASVEVDEIGTEGVVIGHTKKIKQWDKRAALDMAMKFHGAYEKDNSQKQPVIIQATALDEDI